MAILPANPLPAPLSPLLAPLHEREHTTRIPSPSTHCGLPAPVISPRLQPYCSRNRSYPIPRPPPSPTWPPWPPARPSPSRGPACSRLSMSPQLLAAGPRLRWTSPQKSLPTAMSSSQRRLATCPMAATSTRSVWARTIGSWTSPRRRVRLLPCSPCLPR